MPTVVVTEETSVLEITAPPEVVVTEQPVVVQVGDDQTVTVAETVNQVVVEERPVKVTVTNESVSVIEVGVQGPPGPVGPPGSNQPSYEHSQGTPSTLWTVNHPLNKRPSVTIIDSGGSVVEGNVTYISNSQLTVQFTAAFGGVAICN